MQEQIMTEKALVGVIFPVIAPNITDGVKAGQALLQLERPSHALKRIIRYQWPGCEFGLICTQGVGVLQDVHGQDIAHAIGLRIQYRLLFLPDQSLCLVESCGGQEQTERQKNDWKPETLVVPAYRRKYWRHNKILIVFLAKKAKASTLYLTIAKR